MEEIKKSIRKQGNKTVADKNKELTPFFEYSVLKRANFEMIALKTKFSDEEILIYFDSTPEEMDDFCIRHFKKTFADTMKYMRMLRKGRYSILNDERIKVDGVVAKEFFKGEGIIEEQKQGFATENIFIIGHIKPTKPLTPKKDKKEKQEG